MRRSETKTKDFLIRGMPIALYDLLVQAAQQHHRSRTQEAIVALTNGLTTTTKPLTKPEPFRWGQKISEEFIRTAIDEGRA